MKCSTVAAAITVIVAGCLLRTAAARDAQQLDTDTVICLKNDYTEMNAIAVIYEIFRKDRFNVRNLEIAPGKTYCMRYRDIHRVRADFFFPDQKDEVLLRFFRGVCKTVRPSTARYFTLNRDADRERICAIDESKSDAELREMVKEVRPIMRP